MTKQPYDKKLFLDRHKFKIESILSLYNNELPYPVAEYFCKLFLPVLTSTKRINYDLFKTFAPYKRNTKFIFQPGAKIDPTSFNHYFITLKGIMVELPFETEDEFSMMIVNTVYGYNSELNWEDDDERRMAICTITF